MKTLTFTRSFSVLTLYRKKGAMLLICMLMLAVILLLGISTAQIALQEEKTSRNEMDRQIAFQAAEDALSDAEVDIQASPDAIKSRSNLFTTQGVSGLPENADFVCGVGIENNFLGICRGASEGASPVWQGVNFLENTPAYTDSVPYGRFTGQVFQIGGGSLSEEVPRYLIELIPDNAIGQRSDQMRYVYRITAIGFGAHQKTQVVLQALYRKLD